MNRLIVVIIILVFTSCSVSRHVVLNGEFEETNWGPMWEKYIFNNDSIFFHYYGDDTHGSFDKGKFTLIGRKLHLDYDSLIVDKPVCKYSEKSYSDSLKLSLVIMNAGSADKIQIYNKDELVKEKSLVSDSVFIRVKRPCDNLQVKILNDYVIKQEIKYEFNVNVKEFSCCTVEYYPSNSWYKFNREADEIIKLKKLSETSFETQRGKYKWIFKKK